MIWTNDHGPIESIEAKPNDGRDWVDIRHYVPDYTLNARFESEPYRLQNNEIRLRIWDNDGEFLEPWSAEITEIEVRFQHRNVLFQGMVEVPPEQTKAVALGYDATRRTKLVATEQADQIDFGISGAALSEQISPFFGLLGSGFELQPGQWIALLFEQIGGGNVSILFHDLPLDPDQGENYINSHYFYDPENDDFEASQMTGLEFLKALTRVFDYTFDYDRYLDRITFYDKAAGDPTLTQLPQTEGETAEIRTRPAWYNGVEYRFGGLAYKQMHPVQAASDSPYVHTEGNTHGENVLKHDFTIFKHWGVRLDGGTAQAERTASQEERQRLYQYIANAAPRYVQQDTIYRWDLRCDTVPRLGGYYITPRTDDVVFITELELTPGSLTDRVKARRVRDY